MGAKVEGTWSKNCLPYTGRGCPTSSSANLSKSVLIVIGPTVLVDPGAVVLAAPSFPVLPGAKVDLEAVCPLFVPAAVRGDWVEFLSPALEGGHDWAEFPSPGTFEHASDGVLAVVIVDCPAQNMESNRRTNESFLVIKKENLRFKSI
jgi:hypothetical protein